MSHRALLPQTKAASPGEVLSISGVFGQDMYEHGDLAIRAQEIADYLGFVVIISSRPFFNPVHGISHSKALDGYLEGLKRQSDGFNNEITQIFGKDSDPNIHYVGQSGAALSASGRATLTDDYPAPYSIILLDPVGLESYTFKEGFLSNIEAEDEQSNGNLGRIILPDGARQQGGRRLIRTTRMLGRQVADVLTEGHAWKYPLVKDLAKMALHETNDAILSIFLAENGKAAFKFLKQRSEARSMGTIDGNKHTDMDLFVEELKTEFTGFGNRSIIEWLPNTNHASFENDDLLVASIDFGITTTGLRKQLLQQE